MNVDVLGRPRRRRVYLTEIQISRVITLIQEGHSRRQVARMLNVSRTAINRAWRRYQTHGIVRRQPYPHRARATSQREDRLIRLWATRVRRSTATTLQNQLVEGTGTIISTQTVRNRLHERQLHARRTAKVPPLTPEHRRARRLFAVEHVNWNLEQWSNVLFTDESRFSLNHIDGRVRVWRRPGERYLDCTVDERVPFGGGSIMVWGGISLNGRTELVVIREGSMTARRYIDEVIEPHVVPFAENVGPEFILQQDNARPHTARIVQDYLNVHNIEVMYWPARSPDLNAIEHVWDTLGKRLKDHQPIRNLEHLIEILLEEWEQLAPQVIRNLVESMPRRCAEVLRVRGGHTRY